MQYKQARKDMNINILEEIQQFKRNGYMEISDALRLLHRNIQHKKWYQISEKNIGFINMSGISLYIKYGNILAQISIEDTLKECVAHDFSERIIALKLKITEAFGLTPFPLTCLTRLLSDIKQVFPQSLTVDKSNCILVPVVAHSCPISFIELCDTVFKMRAKSNNDVKKFLCSISLIENDEIQNYYESQNETTSIWPDPF